MKSSLFRNIIYASILLAAGCASHQEVIRTDSRISNIEKSRDQFQVRMEDFRKSQMEKDQQLRSQYAELYATVLTSTALGTLAFAAVSVLGESLLRRRFGMSLGGR